MKQRIRTNSRAVSTIQIPRERIMHQNFQSLSAPLSLAGTSEWEPITTVTCGPFKDWSDLLCKPCNTIVFWARWSKEWFGKPIMPRKATLKRKQELVSEIER